MRIILATLTLWLLFVSSVSLASSVDTYQFSTPEYEVRFQELNKILRCPKCQNQNLADSNSMISQDLRKEVHRLIEEGRSDEQIMEFMVMRYGDFVLYKPKVDKVTYFLWYGPIGFGVLGLLILIGVVWQQRQKRAKADKALSTDSEGLSDKEQQALDKILGDSER